MSGRYRRNFIRAAIIASVAHLCWFMGWMIYRHFNPETDERHATVVHLVEVGLPPEPKIEPPKSIAPPKAAPPTTVGTVKATPPRAAAANPIVKKTNGEEGRARARSEVTDKLQATTKSVESALEDLSSALSTAQDGQPEPSRPRGRRSMRSGRSGSDVGGLNTSGVGSGRADVAASAIDGSLVAIESVSGLTGSGGTTGTSGDPGSGSDGTEDGKSVARSNASLLAVVRKYAAGIQFCYENELKHQPGLQGKLVVSLTVAPSGQVTDVKVVDDTLRSAALRDCATSQMRAWKFPPVADGTISFRAPFVFTPPKQADKMVG
jgi:TonB family protein